MRQPAPPIWLGSFHPDALRRAARLGDGWMGAGGSSTAAFAQAVPQLHGALPAEVGEQLEALVAAGATHLLLNPVTRYDEQLEALAAITGLG